MLFAAPSLDVVALQRDFDFVIVGAVDVQEALKLLDTCTAATGFKEAVKTRLNFDVDKQQQNFDWRKRPLLPTMLKYARDDSHLLLRLWNVVRLEVQSFYLILPHFI